MNESEGNPILTVGQIRAERGLAMFVEGVLVQHAGRIMEGLRATGMVDPSTTQRVLLKVSTRLFDIAPQNGEAERGDLGAVQLRGGPARAEEPGEARRLGPGKKAKATRKTAKRPRKAEEKAEMGTCPICGVPISRKAVGCRKHWREVKRRREPGWEDERKAQ